MEPFRFDDQYLVRLRFRDANTLSHFHSYFQVPVLAKLRSQFQWDQAEDLAQEVFVAALEGIDTGAPNESSKLPGYVMGICRNLARRKVEDIVKHRTVDIEHFEFLERRPSPEDHAVSKSLVSTVRGVLRRLSVRDREVLVRVFYYGEDREQVSQQMGLSRSHLRLVLCRGLQRFGVEWKRTQSEKVE